MGEGRRATSLVAFRQSVDVDWPVRLTTLREAPAFADATDERRFRDAQRAQLGAVSDEVRLVRRSDQYVSMSRFSEGSVFDRSGVSRALGYLEGSPPAPWLWRDAAGLWADEAALAAAPHHETSCLVFYNGNLHNYYHWVVEGLLSLDVLARAMGPDADVSILLPTSMDVAAVFDHRRSLRAVGLDGYPVEEVTAGLVRVREAIWVDSDLVQSMPATYLQDFRRRVAARHAGTGGRRHRLLVARRGPTRTIRNFDAVQDVLAAHGFETVYLEGLSVEAQIRLFQAAEFVVSPHGAGLANLLFCPAATKVIELMPSVEVRPFFWLISTKLDLVHGVLLCPPAGADGFQAALDVDLDKLQTLYRKVNARG